MEVSFLMRCGPTKPVAPVIRYFTSNTHARPKRIFTTETQRTQRRALVCPALKAGQTKIFHAENNKLTVVKNKYFYPLKIFEAWTFKKTILN
ncbi:MAG: hypothetical protein JRJ51_19225 [Deltaproteobacteria bacterium]|nr:hypothetical protein [Deltaproteobacteria bacterium]